MPLVVYYKCLMAQASYKKQWRAVTNTAREITLSFFADLSPKVIIDRLKMRFTI